MQTSPLAGKRILITRAAEQQAATAKAVETLGAIPVGLPCLAVQCLPQNIRALPPTDACSDALFTSANGVHCVADTLGEATLTELLQDMRLAAVGHKTAAALRDHGITPDLLPDEASQEGLLAAYEARGLPQRLLFFRAEDGRDLLTDALTRRGCHIEMIHAYRSICPEDNADEVRSMLARHEIDAVLLGSPRTASRYVTRIGDTALADRPVIAVISELTAEAARVAGLHVQVVAEDASFEAMLSALADHFSRNASQKRPQQGE